MERKGGGQRGTGFLCLLVVSRETTSLCSLVRILHMGVGTTIEWTTATWNPLTGCTKISPGCAHCYAERMSNRLKLMGQPNYVNGFELNLHERMLDQPLRWKKPQSIFVNSMSDLFHKDVPFDFIRRVFDVMSKAHWHQF